MKTTTELIKYLTTERKWFRVKMEHSTTESDKCYYSGRIAEIDEILSRCGEEER